MTGPLYAIGRVLGQHWSVIGAWVVLVAISFATGSKTSENLTLPGTGSTLATELLEEDLPEQAYGSPRWLDRVIPHVSIEGEEYFAARDAAAAAVAPAPAAAAPASD